MRGGGAASAPPHPRRLARRDAKITQIYKGTSQIQRMVVARQLLK